MGPDDVVLRDESFVLLRAPVANAAAITRRLSTYDGPFWFANREEESLTLLVVEPFSVELGDLLAGSAFEEHRYRVITFTPPLPWDLVGFLSSVTRALAEVKIPLGAISAFDRDHLFVRADLADRALGCLRDALQDGRIG